MTNFHFGIYLGVKKTNGERAAEFSRKRPMEGRGGLSLHSTSHVPAVLWYLGGSLQKTEMRRSAAPSVVWKKKKLADGSALAVAVESSPSAGEKVNHLDAYKEKENVPMIEEQVEDLGRRTRHEVRITKKNFAINDPAATPLCFAVKFINANRTAKKNLEGHGSLSSYLCFSTSLIYSKSTSHPKYGL